MIETPGANLVAETLIATSRSNFVSVARYTSPKFGGDFVVGDGLADH
ncbi:MAG: hypothetical protein O2960_17485 [Verrucomicrobia bacterium]|nr:hypothetical protein [Verrucomicrobiota bacterium]